MRLVIAVAVLVLLAVPIGEAAKPGKDPPSAPAPPQHFYFLSHDCSVSNELCTPTRQPTTTTPPTAEREQVLTMRPYGDGLGWMTPVGTSIKPTGDTVKIILWGDAWRGLDGTFDGASVILWRDYGFHVGTQPLVYQPGTGIQTPLGVINGQFVATFSDLSLAPTGFTWMLWHTDYSQLTVKFGSQAMPSCLAFKSDVCPA
jgi:hypothetical protein